MEITSGGKILCRAGCTGVMHDIQLTAFIKRSVPCSRTDMAFDLVRMVLEL